MSRIDCSNYLIHFTKGTNLEEAYATFKKIIKDSKLLCGTGFIKKEKCCICFTEAPINCLNEEGILNQEYFKRYSPFGLLFKKKYIYYLGGRPVIYSHPSEYKLISDSLKWRYVRYEPNFMPRPIDYTWEREWRLNLEELKLDSKKVKLVFPDKKWRERFEKEHYEEEHLKHEECECERTTKIINYEELFDPSKAEELIDLCPEPTDLPWIMTSLISEDKDE